MLCIQLKDKSFVHFASLFDDNDNLQRHNDCLPNVPSKLNALIISEYECVLIWWRANAIFMYTKFIRAAERVRDWQIKNGGEKLFAGALTTEIFCSLTKAFFNNCNDMKYVRFEKLHTVYICLDGGLWRFIYSDIFHSFSVYIILESGRVLAVDQRKAFISAKCIHFYYIKLKTNH